MAKEQRVRIFACTWGSFRPHQGFLTACRKHGREHTALSIAFAGFDIESARSDGRLR